LPAPVSEKNVLNASSVADVPSASWPSGWMLGDRRRGGVGGRTGHEARARAPPLLFLSPVLQAVQLPAGVADLDA
jgi:hypothetical protein